MSEPLTFTIIGQPVPKDRPKHFFAKGKMWGYTTKKTREAEAALRLQIVQQLPKNFAPLNCPLKLEARFLLTKPKSNKLIFPAIRPDLDNLLKTAMDAMNKVVFTDDKLICHIETSKEYAQAEGFAGIIIVVREATIS